ncbi:hypothetical protein E2562_020852, partial [Oryza meyeriana var. granulata]
MTLEHARERRHDVAELAEDQTSSGGRGSPTYERHPDTSPAGAVSYRARCRQ